MDTNETSETNETNETNLIGNALVPQREDEMSDKLERWRDYARIALAGT